MDPAQFETQLRVDGFTDVEHVDLAARPGKGRHRHHFAIRGLILDGAFVVTQTGDPVTYGPGEVFSVEEGELHDEAVGADGARVIIGRRYARVD